MPPPPEEPVPAYRSRKDSRIAVLLVSRNPIGIELRLELDGALAWSRTYRTTEEFLQDTARVQGELVERGWEPEPIPSA